MGRRWPPPPDNAEMARMLDERATRLLLLGVGGTLLGVVLTWGFRVGRGFVASPFFLVLIGGVGALLAGIAAAQRQARGRRQWNAMRRAYVSVLDGLAACEPNFRARRQWLHEHGVTHRLLGKHLTDVVAQATDDARGRAEPQPESVVPTIAKGRDTSFPPIRDLAEVEHQLVEADLARFEERHGVTLPAPYQRFLLRFNGGVLKPDWFAYGPEGSRREAYVRRFHPLGSTGPTDLEALCEAERERLDGGPPELLPFAVTREGEQICLAVAKDSDGAVYLREEGADAPTLVADDFFAFLGSITWAPGTKPPPAPRRRPRRRRIRGRVRQPGGNADATAATGDGDRCCRSTGIGGRLVAYGGVLDRPWPETSPTSRHRGPATFPPTPASGATGSRRWSAAAGWAPSTRRSTRTRSATSRSRCSCRVCPSS